MSFQMVTMSDQVIAVPAVTWQRLVVLHVEPHYNRSLRSFTSCMTCKGDEAGVAKDRIWDQECH